MITQQPARKEMADGAVSVVAVAATAGGEGVTAMFGQECNCMGANENYYNTGTVMKRGDENFTFLMFRLARLHHN